jgi:hypothetical protein
MHYDPYQRAGTNVLTEQMIPLRTVRRTGSDQCIGHGVAITTLTTAGHGKDSVALVMGKVYKSRKFLGHVTRCEWYPITLLNGRNRISPEMRWS